MVCISSNGIIQMRRGDTWTLNLKLDLGTKMYPRPYTLQEGEYLYFGVMEANTAFKDALICKKLSKDDLIDGTENEYKLEFVTKDTECVLPGTYFYETKLLRSGDRIDTVIPKTKFILLD